MISLIDLLDEVSKDVEERSVWRTYANRFGARNTAGQVRYFKDREKASQFARGEIKGPKIGRPTPAKKARPKEKVQTYDTTPLVRKDSEASS
jgi:hypothetical protein